MSAQVPSAVFPVAPPVAHLPIIDSAGRLNPVGLNLITQLWAGLQGRGGVKQDTDTIFGMSGDATIDSAGVLTISDDAITTPKIADEAVTYAKIQKVGGGALLGNGTGAAAAVEEIAVGVGLLLAAGVLAALTPAQTVASLPAGQNGERRIVSDATVTTFASVVAGGGANTVPVYWDAAGSAWRIG